MRGAIDHQEMCYAICKFFWQHFPNNFDICRAGVLIEKQWFNESGHARRHGLATAGHKIVVMEAAFNAVAQAKYQCFTKSVDPKSVKAHFGTAKGSHDENKKAGMEYCTKTLGLEEFNSHKADALLQLLYYSFYQLQQLWSKATIKPFTIKFVESNEITALGTQ